MRSSSNIMEPWNFTLFYCSWENCNCLGKSSVLSKKTIGFVFLVRNVTCDCSFFRVTESFLEWSYWLSFLFDILAIPPPHIRYVCTPSYFSISQHPLLFLNHNLIQSLRFFFFKGSLWSSDGIDQYRTETSLWGRSGTTVPSLSSPSPLSLTNIQQLLWDFAPLFFPRVYIIRIPSHVME